MARSAPRSERSRHISPKPRARKAEIFFPPRARFHALVRSFVRCNAPATPTVLHCDPCNPKKRLDLPAIYWWNLRAINSHFTTLNCKFQRVPDVPSSPRDDSDEFLFFSFFFSRGMGSAGRARIDPSSNSMWPRREARGNDGERSRVSSVAWRVGMVVVHPHYVGMIVTSRLLPRRRSADGLRMSQQLRILPGRSKEPPIGETL